MKNVNKVCQQTNRSSHSSSAFKENCKVDAMQNIINQNCGNGGVNSSQLVCPENKLNYLESNLNRLCVQQDALMPLLQFAEYLPVIQKYDTTLKNVTKKFDEFENRQVKVERIVEQRLKEKVDKSPLQKLETAKLSKNVDTLNQQLKDLELNFNNVHRWYEAKLKEESQTIQRSLEVKLEKQKNDFKNQLYSIKSNTSPLESMNVSTIQQSQVTREELFSFKQELMSEIKSICFEKLDNLRSDLNAEMRNIYKEIGSLRCDVEYISNLERKNKITSRVHDELSEKQLSQIEQQVIINILEQECFIEDLESFDKENTVRITQEINSINQDCQVLSQELEQQEVCEKQKLEKKQKEIEYLFEKNVNLKYQLAGTKKKYANEITKIEEKFIILDQINSNIQREQMTEQQEQNLYIIKSLELKLGELMKSINENLENEMNKIQQTENQLGLLKKKLCQIYQQ
ncbi:hypothetical protein ABPG72_001188 [Tetrahymena utriculariae]